VRLRSSQTIHPIMQLTSLSLTALESQMNQPHRHRRHRNQTHQSHSPIAVAQKSTDLTLQSHAPITRSNHTPASYTAIVHSDHTLLSHNPIIHSHRTLESYTPLAHFSLTQSDRKKPHYWSYQYSEKYCCAYFILFAQSLYTSAGQASDPARHRGGRGGARRPLYVRWTRLSSWPRQLLQHTPTSKLGGRGIEKRKEFRYLP